MRWRGSVVRNRGRCDARGMALPSGQGIQPCSAVCRGKARSQPGEVVTEAGTSPGTSRLAAAGAASGGRSGKRVALLPPAIGAEVHRAGDIGEPVAKQ